MKKVKNDILNVSFYAFLDSVCFTKRLQLDSRLSADDVEYEIILILSDQL